MLQWRFNKVRSLIKRRACSKKKKKNTWDAINLISEYEWNFHPYSRARKNIKRVSVFLDYSRLWTLLIQVGHITSRTVFIYLHKGNRKTISCRENDYSTSFESPRTSGKIVVNATASFLSPSPPFSNCTYSDEIVRQERGESTEVEAVPGIVTIPANRSQHYDTFLSALWNGIPRYENSTMLSLDGYPRYQSEKPRSKRNGTALHWKMNAKRYRKPLWIAYDRAIMIGNDTKVK